MKDMFNMKFISIIVVAAMPVVKLKYLRKLGKLINFALLFGRQMPLKRLYFIYY